MSRGTTVDIAGEATGIRQLESLNSRQRYSPPPTLTLTHLLETTAAATGTTTAHSHRPVNGGPDFKVKSSLNFEPRSRQWNQTQMAKYVGRELTFAIAVRRSKPKEHDFSLIVVTFADGGFLRPSTTKGSPRSRFPIGTHDLDDHRVKQSARRNLVRATRSGSV